MKTHQEIHDAINHVSRSEICSPADEAIVDILHALNDRIQDSDSSVMAAFKAIDDLDRKKKNL